MDPLVGRIREALAGRAGVTEQAKMGGITFLVDGKVCVRARLGELMVRCRPERTDELLARPHVRRFEMTGKPNMKGWLVVAAPGIAAEADLAGWVAIGLDACAAA